MLSLSLYLQCIVMFILGQILYMLWIKVPSLKLKAASANKPFSYAELWKCDAHVILGLNVVGISLFVGLDQALHYKPEAINYLKWLFWVVGAFGCTVGFKYFSRYEKTLMAILDKKSNAFDKTIGTATTVTEVIKKSADLGIDANKPTNT